MSARRKLSPTEGAVLGAGLMFAALALTGANPSAEEASAQRVLRRFAPGLLLSSTDGYVLTFDSATGTWGGEAAAGGGNETLAQTLALGSVTGGTDVTLSTGDDLRATTALVTTAATTATHGATGAVALVSGADANNASNLGVTLTLQDGSLGSAVLYAANLYLADRAGTGSMGQITTPGVSGASQGLALNFVAGTGGPTDGQGGTATFQAGAGGGNGDGGNLVMSGGNASGGNGAGGPGTLTGGSPSGAGDGGGFAIAGGTAPTGTGGFARLDAGPGGSGVGNARLRAGSATVDGSGGTCTVLSGDGAGTGDGAPVLISAGDGSSGVDGGSVTITAGSAGSGVAGGIDLNGAIVAAGVSGGAGSVSPVASYSIATTGLTVPVVTTGRWLGQDESGAVCVAATDQTYTLRSGLVAGTVYTFVNGATGDDFTVQTSGGDVIHWSGGTSPDTSIVSSTAGSKLTLVYVGSGIWRATLEHGTLTGS